MASRRRFCRAASKANNKRILRNTRSMASSRCRVSFTDSEGILHGVDVDAESLYEGSCPGPALPWVTIGAVIVMPMLAACICPRSRLTPSFNLHPRLRSSVTCALSRLLLDHAPVGERRRKKSFSSNIGRLSPTIQTEPHNFPSSQLVARIGLSAYKWPSGNAFRVGRLLCYPALAFGAIHDQN